MDLILTLQNHLKGTNLLAGGVWSIRDTIKGVPVSAINLSLPNVADQLNRIRPTVYLKEESISELSYETHKTMGAFVLMALYNPNPTLRDALFNALVALESTNGFASIKLQAELPEVFDNTLGCMMQTSRYFITYRRN